MCFVCFPDQRGSYIMKREGQVLVPVSKREISFHVGGCSSFVISNDTLHYYQFDSDVEPRS
jgi:hypothetical protein